MDRQPRIEELLNKIIFLRKALAYYAEHNTYASKQGIAPIDIDRGHQARFAIEQTEIIEDYHNTIIDEFNKNIYHVEIEDISEEEKLIKLKEIMKKYGDNG